IDGLFGLQGEPKGLRVNPQLPKHWDKIKVVRTFRGAEFRIEMKKAPAISRIQVLQNGQMLKDNIITDFNAGSSYNIHVKLP
ncbi:MAG: glycosyl hydrolase family 65 protein, partial [Lutimonas sp.]